MSKVQELKRRMAPYIPAPLLKAVRYPKEALFTNGFAEFEHHSPSVLFFTTHKCASTLMREIFKYVNKRKLHLTHLNLEAYLWDTASNDTVASVLSRNSHSYFRDTGLLYAPLRDYVDTSHLSQARVIAMLRDPRDVLVSGYYSTAYAHRPPANPARRKSFLEHREHVRNIGIEQYVMNLAPQLHDRYDRYQKNIPRSNVLTYENMWWNFQDFCRSMAEILGIEIDEPMLNELSDMADVGGTRRESHHAVRRKGTPGDHQEKLPPAMVNELTDMFSTTLKWLYP